MAHDAPQPQRSVTGPVSKADRSYVLVDHVVVGALAMSASGAAPVSALPYERRLWRCSPSPNAAAL